MGIREHEEKRLGKSLDELEGIDSGRSTPGDSSLVVKCLQLRKVPIGLFSVEDLRLMILQREGLMFLVPLAMKRLAIDPLVEGNYFPGDLLCAVLRAGGEFWRRHSSLRTDLERLVSQMAEIPPFVAEALAEYKGFAAEQLYDL